RPGADASGVGVARGGRRRRGHALQRGIDLDRVHNLDGFVAQVLECLLLRILHAERSRDESVQMEFAGAILVIDALCTHQWEVVIVQKMSAPMTAVVVDLVVVRLRSDNWGPHERRRKGRGQCYRTPS